MCVCVCARAVGGWGVKEAFHKVRYSLLFNAVPRVLIG